MQTPVTTPCAEPDRHIVQFYETDAFLADRVSRFIGEGLGVGEPAVIIATKTHRDAFVQRLIARGIDVRGVTERGQLVLLDAKETLHSFLVDGTPATDLFARTVGATLQRLTAAHPGKCIRAYGEMVDLLWRSDQRDAAIRLEEMWNDLAAEFDFSLLCAYVLDSFYKESGIPRICATHSHVWPPERPQGVADPASVAETVQSLVAEISHRIDLEHELRASLRRVRRAEEEARETRADLEDFVTNAVVPIHRVDRHGIIRWANSAELQLLGYTREEYVGRHIAEFHVDRDVIDDILERLMRGETLHDYRARLRTKTGEIRIVEISSNVQRRNGEFHTTRCFSRDVTVQKHAERRAQLLYSLTSALSRALSAEETARVVLDEARGVVGDRTVAVVLLDGFGTTIDRVVRDPDQTVDAMGKAIAVPITFEGRLLGSIEVGCTDDQPLRPEEESLLRALGQHSGHALERARLHDAAQIARAEAEQASRAKDEFLAILGHELRNPLSPILTAVQLMRLRGEVASTREQNIIERQVDHLIHIVDDLLDISRVARGKIQLEKRPVLLRDVLTKAIEITSPLFEERSQRLEVSMPDADVWLEADETRLCQVLSNLLSNAAKYTSPRGHIAVRAGTERGRASIRVSDDGDGISPELLPRIFDLFVQGNRASDRKLGGLGIGLALVRNLVQLHGGTVRAHSDGLGRGSQFVVELPTVELERERPTPQERPHEIRRRIAITPRRILVVDDNEDAGQLLGEMLRSLGHEVTVAVDGPRGLEVAKSFRPEVAILDIGLPIMDGYELATALREQLGTDVRMIAVSGYGQPQDKQRAFGSGFDAHLVKPVSLQKVLATIEIQER